LADRLCPVSSAEEALRLANSSPYGLGASVWTKDVERGIALAKQFRDGTWLGRQEESLKETT